MKHKYIKGSILIFLSWIISDLFGGDIQIHTRYSTSFKFQSTDVWNIDLQYLKDKAIQITISANISLGKVQVAKLISEPVLISQAVQSFTSVSLNTKTLNYYSIGLQDIEQTTGSFPAGNYEICYDIRCANIDCNGNGADFLNIESPFCFEMVVEPPTPLLLASPEDKSELDWPRPAFNWIPPIPLNQVNGFNYIFTLVERNKGQTCPDAIMRNRPLYRQTGIDLTTENYPAELNDLDTGKLYCWKVDGVVTNIPVAQSEVWEFRLKKDSIPPPKNPDQSYIEITNQDGNAVFYTSGKIKLKYSSRTGNRTLTYSIFKAGKAKSVKSGGNLSVQSGENYYDINLDDFTNFRKGETLQILITDEGKVYVLKYIYTSTK